MLTSDFSPKVEIRPFRSCAIYPAIIIGTVRSLWTCLWGRYHVPQNAFLVRHVFLVYYPHFSPSFPFRRKMLPSSPFWGALLAPAGSGGVPFASIFLLWSEPRKCAQRLRMSFFIGISVEQDLQIKAKMVGYEFVPYVAILSPSNYM